MSETPWLSVVIPVFRAEKTITRAIESVMAQGVPGVEIVCVNDDSPDLSAAIIQKMSGENPLIRVVDNPRNLGPGPTRNRGIDEARGTHVVFLDADDLLVAGGLEALRQTVTRHPADLILVGCEEERRGRIKSLTDGPLWDSLLAREVTVSVAEDPRVLFWPPAPWSKVYRREFLIENGLQFGEGVAQDIPWSAGVTLQAQTIAVCPGVFYRYVTADKDSSITTTTSEKNLVRLDQVRAIRLKNDLSAISSAVAQHVSALAAIHLIWSNRAAYRLFPEDTREKFFADSAEELRIWDSIATVPPWLDSRPLMTAFDRDTYSRALRRGDWAHWQKVLQRQKTLSRVRRVFRPGRVFGRR
jgi:glycosyltransferase involved in cell wall biosynthesis